jgi:hypothetical protein
VNYSLDDLRRIAGIKTEQIAAVLGYCPSEDVVHRDNLAVISRDGPINTKSRISRDETAPDNAAAIPE